MDRKIWALIVAGVTGIVLLACSAQLFENLDAGDVMVVQSPVGGSLTWYTTPGLKWQGFGKVTEYHKRAQLWFQAGNEDKSIKIRFNDGGHAQISGGISWEMPNDDESLAAVHTKFGSQSAVEQQLIRTMMEKSVYMTGPLMSSTESYASRRNELLHLIEDQISHGVCLTKTVQRKQQDPITNEDKIVTVVELVTDANGKVQRAESSPLSEFNIKTFNLAINEINYEGRVEEQIQQQQQATMRVQIAIAESKQAEQQVLTTKKEGEATAAKKEWEQRAIAAQKTTEADMEKEVAETEAQKMLAVAKLDKESAEQFKLAQIARGQGESERRKLIMEADGALEKKLETWLKAQQAYASAIGQHQGPWVPSVVMGGGEGHEVGAQQLIGLLTAKTALDLGLDMRMTAPEKQAAKKD